LEVMEWLNRLCLEPMVNYFSNDESRNWWAVDEKYCSKTDGKYFRATVDDKLAEYMTRLIN
jgi:hypothetical protein